MSSIDSIEELRTRLRELVPSRDLLERAIDRVPGGEGLSGWERLAVFRGLERVWHIMRLMVLLSSYFREKIFFGGGALLNYIYMTGVGEPPRLTFDLDATWHVRVSTKRVVLREVVGFNRWLEETGNALAIPVDTVRSVRIYVVEYDVEKDFFPTLLSLRMPVVTRYDGRPFYQFLGLRDYSLITRLRSVFEEVLGVRDARIDYIRLDISLDPSGMPRESVSIRDMLGFTHETLVTPVEYQLAAKIVYKVGRSFGDDLRYNLHDILKAVLDLRLLDYIDKRRVAGYIEDLETTRRVAETNLDTLLAESRALWEHNYHYTLVRRRHSLEEIVERVRRSLAGLG